MARSHMLMSALLCTLLTTQTLLQPALLKAATQAVSDPANQTDPTNSTVLKNPSLDEINLKLETIAKEKGIPSLLLKVIAFKESTWRQFDSQGNPILGSSSTHPALGIMQVATYKDDDKETIEKLKSDIDFNIRMGADLLNEKWRFTPKIGDGDRNKLENWYFALWAYNIWTDKNNPNVLAVNSQAPQSNQPTQSTQSTNTQTLLSYQDKVINLIANPDGFLARYIEPVQITKIPADLLPKEGIPSKTVVWTTPEPFHYGDLGSEQPTQPQPPKELEFIRLAGTDRIDTALQQALKGWPNGTPAVVLARADNFPDALSGVPLAAKLGAPVLLTSSNELDARVEKALKTLKPEKVYLLGGEGALGTEITTKLKELGWGTDRQIRLSGLNRYETAANIALVTSISSPVEAVAIATGENFPDALSIASIAGAKQMPILLTEPKALPRETLKALMDLKPMKVYLIGGEGAISASVQADLQTQLNLSSTNLIRLFGASRYDTMATVAMAFAGETQGLSFATGEDFPDALAGAALAARVKSTVILLPKSSLEEYPNLKNAIDQYPWNSEAQPYIFGGAGAISEEREQELKDLLSKK